MNNLKKISWLTGKNLALFVLGVLVMYMTVTSMLDKRFSEIERNTRNLITDQQLLLIAIAETTARNGADAVTESIVKDCSINERLQFEELLGKLDSKLSQAQLVELERLFGRCGAFFSERKSVMVAKLVREVEILNNYVTQLNVILNDENDSDEFLLETWTELAIEEKKRSDQLAELVQLQDKIITALLNGKSVQSTEILGIMQTVKEVQENLTLSNIKATEARAKLITL